MGRILSANPTGGPSTSTDNALVRFDGATGKTLQNSGVIVDDSNNVSGVVGLTIGGALAGVTTLNASGIITHGGLIATANTFTLASVTGLSKVEYGVAASRAIKFSFANVSVPITFTSGTPDAAGFGNLDLGTLPAALFSRGGAYYLFTTVTAGANITASDTFFIGIGTAQQTTANAGAIVANGDNLSSASGTIVLSGQTASNQSNAASTGSMTLINGITSTRHIYLNFAGVSIGTASDTLTLTGTLWVNVGYVGLP